ncbi:MAG: hypothetical protein ACTSPD_09585 [Promethearchaeota archaeon]
MKKNTKKKARKFGVSVKEIDDLIAIDDFIDLRIIRRGNSCYIRQKMINIATQKGSVWISIDIAKAINRLHYICHISNKGLSIKELAIDQGLNEETLRENLIKLKEIGLVRSYVPRKIKYRTNENKIIESNKKKGRTPKLWTTVNCEKLI